MLENSNVMKIVIFANFEDYQEEELVDVAILLMRGVKVLRCKLIGKYLDDYDNSTAQSILEEETDIRMFDPEVVKFKVKNMVMDSKDIVIKEIYDTVNSYKNIIKRLNGISDDEDDDTEFVIYHDNKPGTMSSELFYELNEFIERESSSIIPTSFKSIFTGTTEIPIIFSKYGYDEIHYVESSAVSNASHVGVAFDFSLGYN